MKATRIFLVIFISLIPSFLLAVETETVGATTYNWYETTWDKDKIFTQAGLLDQVGITLDNFKVANNIGDIDITTIDGSYGGVLIWASHGVFIDGEYYVVAESFTSETAATDRYNYLVTQTGFTADRIALFSNYWTDHSAIGLTDAGIGYLFGGNNAIVLVASCYGGLVGGEWGGRVKVSYNGTVGESTA
ncbi:MAG TPA: hypothetical protein VKO43_09260, partial [Candidatus Krumholzibacteriaceae bacterium]|nr:hypothetical protein [Candidatus Krumholzibacteriaceae bacterium]